MGDRKSQIGLNALRLVRQGIDYMNMFYLSLPAVVVQMAVLGCRLAVWQGPCLEILMFGVSTFHERVTPSAERCFSSSTLVDFVLLSATRHRHQCQECAVPLSKLGDGHKETINRTANSKIANVMRLHISTGK